MRWKNKHGIWHKNGKISSYPCLLRSLQIRACRVGGGLFGLEQGRCRYIEEPTFLDEWDLWCHAELETSEELTDSIDRGDSTEKLQAPTDDPRNVSCSLSSLLETLDLLVMLWKVWQLAWIHSIQSTFWNQTLLSRHHSLVAASVSRGRQWALLALNTKIVVWNAIMSQRPQQGGAGITPDPAHPVPNVPQLTRNKQETKD